MFDSSSRDISLTQLGELHGHVRVQAQVASCHQSRVAASVSYGSVGLLHGRQSGTAGSVDTQTWPGRAQEVRDTIGQHGARAACYAEAVYLHTYTYQPCE